LSELKRCHPAPEQGSLLTASLNDFLDNYIFNIQRPLLAVTLFTLDDNVSELQICLPHTAFDDTSDHTLCRIIECLSAIFSRHYALIRLARAAI
jgi:hypothetical protein